MLEYTYTQAKSIAIRLKTKRRSKGLTQEKLAEVIDVHVRTIQRTENDEYPQPATNVLFWIKTAQVLDTSVEYLINGKE